MVNESKSGKTALITGITGQDGAYLARFLLDKGYEVFGTFRRISTPNFWRLQYLGVGSRMITWIFFEKGGFLSVPPKSCKRSA